MKALYLDGRGGLNVKLDGPALRVRRPGHADGQFPLARVARVVAVGSVHWQPEALSACLREHKPVVELDAQGRFVRVLQGASAQPNGLARHLGELLNVARFRTRYEQWFSVAERTEMLSAVEQFDMGCQDLRPDYVWQRVYLEQHRRRHTRTGRWYRYLLGLAAAHVASALLSIGLPRNPRHWERQEYRLMFDLVRLERWRHVPLLEELLERSASKPERWELTAAFERMSEDRERRIAAWRQRALFAMMGLRPAEPGMAGFEPSARRRESPELPPSFERLRHTLYQYVNDGGRFPSGARGTLRSSVRILSDYLDYDRRMYESYGTA